MRSSAPGRRARRWSPVDKDAQIRHLEAIQGIINRMAQNSFSLKGWSVTLVSALFALAAAKSNPGFALLSYIPACIFWILDGYFLCQEKLFRKLYDGVRLKEAIDPKDFFSMDTNPFVSETPSWLCVTLSPTLRLFHGAILVAITLVMICLCRGATH